MRHRHNSAENISADVFTLYRYKTLFTGCLSNSASNTKQRSSRTRLCRLPFRRTSTNSYNAKWRRGPCGPPTLRVSLCRGHTLRQPSERSVWRLRTSVWNSLPSDIRNASSLSTFRVELKTHLFYCCVLIINFR